jgi:hypothetical protein
MKIFSKNKEIQYNLKRSKIIENKNFSENYMLLFKDKEKEKNKFKIKDIQKYNNFFTNQLNKKLIYFSKKNIHNLEIPSNLHEERTDKIYPKIRKYNYIVNQNEINLKFEEFLIFFENKKFNESLSKGYELLLHYETYIKFDINSLGVIFLMLQISFELEDISQMKILLKKAYLFTSKLDEYEVKENYLMLISFNELCIKFLNNDISKLNEININFLIDKIKILKTKEFTFSLSFPINNNFYSNFYFMNLILNSFIKASSIYLNKFKKEIDINIFLNLINEISNFIRLIRNNLIKKIEIITNIDNLLEISFNYISFKIFDYNNQNYDDENILNALIKLIDINNNNNKLSINNLCILSYRNILCIKNNDNITLNKYLNELIKLDNSKIYLGKIMNIIEEQRYITEIYFDNKLKIISNFIYENKKNQIDNNNNNIEIEIFDENQQSNNLLNFFFKNFNEIKSNRFIETFLYEIIIKINNKNQGYNNDNNKYLRNIINFSTFNLINIIKNNENLNLNFYEKSFLDINDLFELKNISEFINVQALNINNLSIKDKEFNQLNYLFNFKLSKILIRNQKKVLEKKEMKNNLDKFEACINRNCLNSFIINTFGDKIKMKNLKFINRFISKDLNIKFITNKNKKNYLNFEDIEINSFDFKDFDVFVTNINLDFSELHNQINNFKSILVENEKYNLIEKFVFSLFSISDSFYKLAYKNQDLIMKENSRNNSNINYLRKYNNIKNNISYSRIDKYLDISLKIIQYILNDKNEEINKYLKGDDYNNNINQNSYYLIQSIKNLQLKIFILKKYSEYLFTNKSHHLIKESIKKNRNFLLEDIRYKEFYTEDIDIEFKKLIDILN